MVATLGHACGLVDAPQGQRAPARALVILAGLVYPEMLPTWEYQRALARTEGRDQRDDWIAQVRPYVDRYGVDYVRDALDEASRD